MKAKIISPRTGNGKPFPKGIPYHALVQDVLTGQWKCTDATNQPCEKMPTDPDYLIVEIECDEKCLAIIEADPRFKVLWSAENAKYD